MSGCSKTVCRCGRCVPVSGASPDWTDSWSQPPGVRVVPSDADTIAALRADVSRLQADLARAVSYVGGDDIEDVMEALRKAANDAINHETTHRLLTEARADRDDALATLSLARADVVWVLRERTEARAVAALAMDAGLEECERLRARRDEAVEALGAYRADNERLRAEVADAWRITAVWRDKHNRRDKYNRRDAARFLAAGWRRLAEMHRECCRQADAARIERDAAQARLAHAVEAQRLRRARLHERLVEASRTIAAMGAAVHRADTKRGIAMRLAATLREKLATERAERAQGSGR